MNDPMWNVEFEMRNVEVGILNCLNIVHFKFLIPHSSFHIPHFPEKNA
jgi:hypothetical protein